MSEKILAALLLALSVVCFSGIAYGSEEAVNQCNGQLAQKYPNVEAIKKQFGNEAQWREETLTSPHDDTVKLLIKHMTYPGIEIRTMEVEDNCVIVLVDVKKAGFVDFWGIKIGSAREGVIKKFGKPQQVEENKLIYHSESGYTDITFTLKKNKVAEMSLMNYPD